MDVLGVNKFCVNDYVVLLQQFCFSIMNQQSRRICITKAVFFQREVLKKNMVYFSRRYKVKGVPLSKSFIENLKGITKNKVNVHHSHVTGEVIGYTHSYCNLKVREN